MAITDPKAEANFVTQVGADHFDSLPWVLKFKGTAITIAYWVIGIIAIALTMELPIPEYVTVIMAGIVGVAHTLNIRYYKPEPTKASRQRYDELVVQRIDAAHFCGGEQHE